MSTETRAEHDRALTRVVLRPLGNPLPLGFIGLAGATITLAGLQLGWVPVTETHQVGLVLFGFAVPAQLIACVLAFLSRDGPTGSAFGVQAVSWLSVGLVVFTAPAGSHSKALGLLLFLAAAGVLLGAIAASLGKLAAGLVLAVTALRFALSGVAEYTGMAPWRAAAGWVGVVLCALALYAALAADLEDARHRPALPMGRRGRGKHVVIDGLTGMGGNLEREPGVREQL